LHRVHLLDYLLNNPPKAVVGLIYLYLQQFVLIFTKRIQGGLNYCFCKLLCKRGGSVFLYPFNGISHVWGKYSFKNCLYFYYHARWSHLQR